MGYLIMNKINDRDLTELSGYWVYQDLKDNSKVVVPKDKIIDILK